MKKRKLLISTLLAAFACSFVGAICSVASLRVKAEEITYGTPVVYDLWDITGATSFTSSDSTNRNIGCLPDTHNVAFKAKVSYDKNSTRNLVMNFLFGQEATVNTNYYATGHKGYLMNIKDGALSLFYDADPNTNEGADWSGTDKAWVLTTGASLTWTEFATKLEKIDSIENVGSKINTANFKLGRETFLFECGSVKAYTVDGDTSTWTGNYVYVKINGQEVLSFTDTGAYYKDKGSYFGKGAAFSYDYTKYTFETAYSENTLANIEKQVAVYDLYDITGRESGTYLNGYDGKAIGQLPYTSGVAFKTKVSTHADNQKTIHLIDLIITGSSAYTSSNNYGGYRLIWKDNVIRITHDKDTVANTGHLVVAETSANTGDLANKNNCSTAFDLEFGSARYMIDGAWMGNYVYVKVDGVEVLHFVDKGELYKTRGHYVGSGSDAGNWSKYTFNTAYETVANVTVENATVYDLYDVTGKTSGTYLTNYDDRPIGSLSANANVAFKTKVSTHSDNTMTIMFLDLLLNGGNGDGYQLYWRDNSIHLRYDYDFISGANTASENIAVSYGMHNTPENAMTSAFTMEFGSRKYVVNNEWTGNYVYVKINDIEVAHFIDKIDGYDNMGTKISSGPWSGHAKYSYSTTYTDSEIAYKILDTFSMENGASTRNSNNGLRFTMSVSESKWTELQNYIGADKVYSSVTFGMVIVPADYVASKPLTVENLFGNSAVYYLMEKETDGSWKAYNGSLTPIFHLTGNSLTNYQFKGSIVNLEDWNITRNFVGLGYVKYVENDGDEGYVLADYYGGDIANNTRSIYQVAKSAYEADNTRTQLKTNYLDKVTTVTVNYYDASTNEKLATETIYGVIGQTAFAPLRSFDGYTFIAGNNGNATQITVSATGENVLNYYFTANN